MDKCCRIFLEIITFGVVCSSFFLVEQKYPEYSPYMSNQLQTEAAKNHYLHTRMIPQDLEYLLALSWSGCSFFYAGCSWNGASSGSSCCLFVCLFVLRCSTTVLHTVPTPPNLNSFHAVLRLPSWLNGCLIGWLQVPKPAKDMAVRQVEGNKPQQKRDN